METPSGRPVLRDEFFVGPTTVPFGFVQSPRAYIAIHNRPALLSGIIARGEQSGPSKADKCCHSRRDDRNARADADADANGECDLTEAKAARGHADEAERERDDRDDLAA